MDRPLRLSLLRVIQTDYTSFLAVLFLVILWSVYAAFQVLHLEISPGAFYAALGGSVFAVGLVGWRYYSIVGLINRGLETCATITDIWINRGRGRIDYTYNFRGREYLSGEDFFPTARVRKFMPGDRVAIIVDPDFPQRTLIVEIYLDVG